jgi:hypothetical protein
MKATGELYRMQAHPLYADPAWMPTTYRYRDAQLDVLFSTQALFSDEVALDFFPVVWDISGAPPRYVEKKPADGEFKLLPYEYDHDSGEVRSRGGGDA